MSATERVVQSILYELGCVLIGCLVMQFVPHEGQPLVLMIIFSLLAMAWNFVFNWIFMQCCLKVCLCLPQCLLLCT